MDLYLPVQVMGALFSIGDTHAAQGDGEVCGTAIESPMTVTREIRTYQRRRSTLSTLRHSRARHAATSTPKVTKLHQESARISWERAKKPCAA